MPQGGQDGGGHADMTAQSEVWLEGASAQLSTSFKGGGGRLVGQPPSHPECLEGILGAAGRGAEVSHSGGVRVVSQSRSPWVPDGR